MPAPPRRQEWRRPPRRKPSSSLQFSYSLSFFRLLRELAVYQFFGELHTLEIHQPGVLFHMPIQRHPDLPWTGKYLWILDRRFVPKNVRAARSVAFDHVQRVAMIIPRPVEPRALVQSGDVDHQRVPFPVAYRLSHPGIGGGRPRSV